MPTLILDPVPLEIDALLERRHKSGVDLYDEVWEGVLHMNPAPHSIHGKLQQQVARLLDPPARAAGLAPSGPVNVGEPSDYRVPDGALLEPGPDGVYLPTAALVLEIVSPDDETWAKLPFYAAHKVDEVVIVDPQERAIHWLALRGDRYERVERSATLDLSADEVENQISWPESTR